jgi:hypothetical protein
MSWDLLDAAVAEARTLVAAEATDAEIAAEGEAYVSRVTTAALATAFMGHRLVQNGLAMPLPVYGGPNPDYIMRHAAIDAAGRYRLAGRLNGSERVGVGLYTIGRNGAPMIAAYTMIDRDRCGSTGEFALDMAADLSGPGTLAIPQGARIMMVRLLHRDQSPPAHLDFSGGPPLRGPTLVGGSNDGALGFAANMVRANIAEYMKWVAAARDLPNRLDAAPAELAETVVGDADTQYFLGGFDLAEGQWLEVVMPAGLSGYWSLHAYNYWYEHLVTPGVHDRNAVRAADGTVAIAVGSDAPAASPNRIDTLGRRRGALICRIVGHTASIVTPQTTVRSSG